MSKTTHQELTLVDITSNCSTNLENNQFGGLKQDFQKNILQIKPFETKLAGDGITSANPLDQFQVLFVFYTGYSPLTAVQYFLMGLLQSMPYILVIRS